MFWLEPNQKARTLAEEKISKKDFLRTGMI